MAIVFNARQQPSNTLQPDDTSDAALVEAARRNPHAFSPLYHRYVTPLYRFCYVRLGNQQAAEDATSDIFIKALGSLHGFRGGSFPAWLFRIAHNVVVDAHRKRRPSVALDQAGNVASTDPLPEDQAVARTEADRLRRVIQTLPDDQRIVIELGLAGWTTAQIADALGKQPGNVRIIRHRAMQRLKTLLDPPDDAFREHHP